MLRLLGVGAALGVVGPFGTYLAMSLPVRMLHFMVAMLAIGGLQLIATLAVRRLFAHRDMPWAAVVPIALACAPLGAAIVHLQLSIWAPQVLSRVTYAELAVQTAAVNLAMGSLSWWLYRRQLRRLALPAITKLVAVPQAAPNALPLLGPLTEKLPFELRGGAILALQAEDHYVRVHTERGSALILVGIAEAAELMGDAEGLRVHRSHWVAQSAVQGIVRSEGKVAVRLTTGLVLPVSRSGKKLLEDRGFI